MSRNFTYAALMLAVTLTAQGQELFLTANDAVERLEPEPSVIRSRSAVFDQNQLVDSLSDGSPLVLNLFPDARFEATVKESRQVSRGSSFVYAVLDRGGHATLFVAGGIVRGEVHSPHGVYTIKTGGGIGNVRIEQLDASALPPVDHGTLDPSRADASRDRGPIGQVAFIDHGDMAATDTSHSSNAKTRSNLEHRSGSSTTRSVPLVSRIARDEAAEPSDETVGVLVVYTPNAEAHEGEKGEIEATIRAEIEKTNQAFVNSDLSHRKIRLVAMEKIEYTQASNLGADLQVLRDYKGAYYDPDGLLDEVHEMRERYSADLVHLFVNDSRGACGTATRYNLHTKQFVDNACKNDSNPDECIVQKRKDFWRDDSSHSISAIPRGCTVQYSFTHELGHNFGISHDRYSDDKYHRISLIDPVKFPLRPYGFGYVNQNFDRSICFNTMMAYKDQCVDEGYVGSNGVKELMFSNPDVELGSEEVGFDPAGVPGEEWTVALDGPVNASRAIDDVWDIVANLFSKTESGHDVPYMPATGDDRRQGFVRVVNHTHEAGEVAIEAFDDSGNAFDLITLSLESGETAHFNSDDLEMGNAAKGLSGGIGTGEGDWRLKLTSLLEIEVLAYIRTEDGFLTSMHDLMPASRAGRRAPFFNPGSNENQVSMLRLVNDHEQEVEAVVTAVDDVGVESEVRVTIPPNAARTFTAKELEEGSEEFEGSLGDGKGKWRLFVENVNRKDNPYSDKEVRVMAMSLLESPTGHLTNLSTVPRNEYQGTHTVPLFPSKTAQARQGFARVVNLTEEPAEVSVLAYDDNGSEYGPAILSLDGNETAHFNSDDLEDGNEAKGLSGGIGSGQGDWRLELSSESKLEVLAYVRTDDGFVTTMHEAVPSRIHSHRAAVFNPASNANQVSSLRLVNPGDEDAVVSIIGIDGDGLRTAEIRITVSPKASRTLTSQELESGASGFEGSFGDGAGKWQLEIEADREIVAMSLLGSPTGHLTNLSTAPVRGVGPWPPAEMAQ